MRIPSKHSGKWFLMYLLSSFLLLLILLVTVWTMTSFRSESYNAEFLMIMIIPMLFINLIVTLMGFFGWIYMWSFTLLALIASSAMSTVVLLDEKSGWELFVALYLTVLLVGGSGLLGTIVQVIHFIKNRKQDRETIDELSSNGKRIILTYALLLLSGLLYLSSSM